MTSSATLGQSLPLPRPQVSLCEVGRVGRRSAGLFLVQVFWGFTHSLETFITRNLPAEGLGRSPTPEGEEEEGNRVLGFAPHPGWGQTEPSAGTLSISGVNSVLFLPLAGVALWLWVQVGPAAPPPCQFQDLRDRLPFLSIFRHLRRAGPRGGGSLEILQSWWASRMLGVRKEEGWAFQAPRPRGRTFEGQGRWGGAPGGLWETPRVGSSGPGTRVFGKGEPGPVVIIHTNKTWI